MQLIRTILIILLVYYGIKFTTRLLAPLLLKRLIKKMSGNFHKTSYQYTQKKKEKEGDVTINKSSNKKEIKTNNVGDYVDFEEINE
tara:strand:- start:704 stop:961 length:258 start_codon:yes stop_codon:yes gene_type:complete